MVCWGMTGAGAASSRQVSPPPPLNMPLRVVAQLGHGDEVFCAAFSPSGGQIASGGSDGTVVVWDATSGRQLKQFDIPSRVDALEHIFYSPDGQTILATDGEEHFFGWQTSAGKPLLFLDEEGEPATAETLIFSPDGNHLLTLDNGDNVLWNLRSAKAVKRLGDEPASSIEWATFSNQGNKLLIRDDDTAWVMDAEDGRTLYEIKDDDLDAIDAAAYSPSGRQILVTPSSGAEAWIFDSTTGKAAFRLKGHTESVNSAAYSPDGKWIATASDDKTIIVWNATNSKRIWRSKVQEAAFSSVEFSQDGKRLLTLDEDDTIATWDAGSRRLLQIKNEEESLKDVSFTASARQIVAKSGTDEETIMLYSAATGKKLYPGEDEEGQAVPSPDGRRMVVIATDDTGKNSAATVRDAESGKQLYPLKGHGLGLQMVAFGPRVSFDRKTKRMAGVMDKEETVTIVDTATSKKLLTLEHTSSVSCVLFSEDGTRIYTGCADGTVTIWNAAIGEEISHFKKQTEAVRCIADDSEGKRLVTGSEDDSVVLWDVAAQKPLLTLDDHEADVYSVDLSSDGTRIASGDATGQFIQWDAVSGKKLLQLQAHQSELVDVTYTEDGKRILTGSADKSCLILDAVSGQILTQFNGHQGPILRVGEVEGNTKLMVSIGFFPAQWDPKLGIHVT